jgi:hypothetical protein
MNYVIPPNPNIGTFTLDVWENGWDVGGVNVLYNGPITGTPPSNGKIALMSFDNSDEVVLYQSAVQYRTTENVFTVWAQYSATGGWEAGDTAIFLPASPHVSGTPTGLNYLQGFTGTLTSNPERIITIEHNFKNKSDKLMLLDDFSSGTFTLDQLPQGLDCSNCVVTIAKVPNGVCPMYNETLMHWRDNVIGFFYHLAEITYTNTTIGVEDFPIAKYMDGAWSLPGEFQFTLFSPNCLIEYKAQELESLELLRCFSTTFANPTGQVIDVPWLYHNKADKYFLESPFPGGDSTLNQWATGWNVGETIISYNGNITGTPDWWSNTILSFDNLDCIKIENKNGDGTLYQILYEYHNGDGPVIMAEWTDGSGWTAGTGQPFKLHKEIHVVDTAVDPLLLGFLAGFNGMTPPEPKEEITIEYFL